MKFYGAGLVAFTTDAPLYSQLHDHALGSYFGENQCLETALKYYPHIFLDSGAFSAKTRGVKIDIKEYAGFLHRYGSRLDVYANLDSIGNPEETLQNQKILEKEGLKPLPVYHSGEDVKYLKYYIENYEYIALGGMVGTKDTNRWLETVFNKYPDKKFHGFGMTDFGLILKYPFYSVDSTTWFCAQKFGVILFPDNTSNHYDELTKEQIKQIEDKGFSVQMMKDKYQTRNAWNLLVVKAVIENVKNKFVGNEYNNIMKEVE